MITRLQKDEFFANYDGRCKKTILPSYAVSYTHLDVYKRQLLYNSKNNIVVLTQNKLAVIDGLEGYLIAESDNVLLICKKDEEHSIRKYVNDAQIKLGEDYI